MFKITCTTSGVEYLLYAPNVPECRVTAPMLALELNKSGMLTFGVPDAHPNRAQILPLTSDITVYEDGAAIWYGRSITNEKNFYKTGKITCEGELAFLYDSIYRPFAYTGTITDFLTALIANHNAQVETRKEFTLGTVSVIDSNGNVARSSETALKTLDAISTRLIDTNGGYLRVRHAGAVRYLDYLADYGNTATQKIEFAKNLIDLTQFIDATKVRTVLIPYGAEIPGAADGERLTIESVNSGLDYISNAGAVASFGQIWETVIFNDVTVATNLLAKATAHLSELIAQSVTLKLSMVDLAVLGVETRINIGDWVRAKSVPHGLDSLFLATAQNIDILHPESTKMSFGSTKQSFTTQNNQKKLDVSKAVDAVNARILLATQLITGAVGGYVVFDPPERPERILIMDTPDQSTAQNVWQWNVNGLGYSSTGINGPYGTAITMDGGIVGTYIITGRIKSGDGDTYFDLDTPEIVQNAIINGKAVKVEVSPVNPFKLSIMGVTNMQDYIYVTDATGYSGANILVTSKYDVNEDGVVDWKDLKILADYVLHLDISPGVTWPAGYPTFARMDLDDNGLVNSSELNQLWTNMPSSDRVTFGSHQLGLDLTGAWISDDWGDSPVYLAKYINGTVVWDPASLVDGAGETSAAITVTGVAFGDMVLVGNPYDLQGILCHGYISAADTVKIRVQNETGGTIDLASGTWNVKVIKNV